MVFYDKVSFFSGIYIKNVINVIQTSEKHRYIAGSFSGSKLESFMFRKLAYMPESCCCSAK